MPTTYYPLHTTHFKLKHGFSLIELLTVITLIGILVSMAFASYSTTQAKGRDSRRKTDLDTIKKALELAKIDSAGQYYYPTCDGGVNNCALSNTNTAPDISPTYTQNVPTDVKTKTGYIFATFAADGTTLCTTNCPTYQLIACLENKNDPQKDTTTYPSCTDASYTIKPN